MSIQNEVLNTLNLVQSTFEGTVEIDAKVKTINEEELDRIARQATMNAFKCESCDRKQHCKFGNVPGCICLCNAEEFEQGYAKALADKI